MHRDHPDLITVLSADTCSHPEVDPPGLDRGLGIEDLRLAQERLPAGGLLEEVLELGDVALVALVLAAAAGKIDSRTDGTGLAVGPTVAFDVEVPAEGKVTVKYTATYTW